LKILAYIDNKYLYLFFRLTLGVIFIWASIDKIINPDEFAKIVYNYRILPDFTINLFGIVLPWIEFFCGLFLVLDVKTKSSSFILSVMLVIFIAALIASILRGLDINCGCFDTDASESSKVSYSLIGRDFLMFLMGIYLIVFTSEFFSFSKWIRKLKFGCQ